MGQYTLNKDFNRLSDLVGSWLEEESRVAAGDLARLAQLAVMSSGKRVRPILCVATAEALGVEADSVKEFAVALELLHTSSLIHDDLPALDNDDLRRGEPTLHKRIGEALAILSGDLLIIQSFSLLSRIAPGRPPEASRKWVEIFSAAASDLCEGQTLDLAMMSRVELEQRPAKSLETLKNVCLKKTAALFRAAVLGPTVFLEKPEPTVSALTDYADHLGLLFQITDDLLDSKEEGTDSSFSYVSELGYQRAEQECDLALAKALTALESVRRGDISFLREFAVSIRKRDR